MFFFLGGGESRDLYIIFWICCKIIIEKHYWYKKQYKVYYVKGTKSLYWLSMKNICQLFSVNLKPVKESFRLANTLVENSPFLFFLFCFFTKVISCFIDLLQVKSNWVKIFKKIIWNLLRTENTILYCYIQNDVKNYSFNAIFTVIPNTIIP